MESSPKEKSYVLRDLDLQSSVVGLSQLIMGEGQDGLERLLRSVAELAVKAIPGADGAGLTLHETGRVDTMVATDELVKAVDAVQYGIGEGPCITAAATAQTVTSGALHTSEQWPRFGPEVDRLGVHSALSLPLLVGNEVLGAMNIYALAENAFDQQAVERGESFAAQAAISVQHAQLIAETTRVVKQVQAAAVNSTIIDQALGILISRNSTTAEEAHATLQAMSRSQNRQMVVVAQYLVDQSLAGIPPSVNQTGDENA